MTDPLMPARRRICVVADDFGLHAGIDQAIVDLAGRARLQAFGCMTGGRSWQASAAALRVDPPGADIGLHVDLTERPISRPAQALRSLIIDAYARRLDLRAVRAELRAQLNAFEAALGRAPDYVDGHQHVHQLPGVRAELLAELEARYALRERPWLRCTIPGRLPQGAGAQPLAPFAVRLKEALIATLGGVALQREAWARHFAMNTALLGVYGFNADRAAYQALLTGWLASAPDGTALMCHPALSTEPSDAIARARLVEYDLLGSPVLPDLLARFHIETRPMREILRSSATTESALPDHPDAARPASDPSDSTPSAMREPQ